MTTKQRQALQDVQEFLLAQAATEGAGFWRLRRWAEKHDLYIDDLGTQRAFMQMALVAERVLAGVLNDDVSRDD